MSQSIDPAVLEEMVKYYRARAAEYDEWFYRQGRYDRGEEANNRWFAEVEQVYAAFDALAIGGDVLELAPGTGIWTERLIRAAHTVTAVDASPEMIALNQAKLGADAERVIYIQDDIFTWQPDRAYDACCFGFWLSHVPLEQLPAFLGKVASALRPGGKLFFVDSRRADTSSATDHELQPEGEQLQERKLNDGRAFKIVKNYLEPADLVVQCQSVGLDVEVRLTETYFVYGTGTKVT